MHKNNLKQNLDRSRRGLWASVFFIFMLFSALPPRLALALDLSLVNKRGMLVKRLNVTLKPKDSLGLTLDEYKGRWIDEESGHEEIYQTDYEDIPYATVGERAGSYFEGIRSGEIHQNSGENFISYNEALAFRTAVAASRADQICRKYGFYNGIHYLEAHYASIVPESHRRSSRKVFEEIRCVEPLAEKYRKESTDRAFEARKVRKFILHEHEGSARPHSARPGCPPPGGSPFEGIKRLGDDLLGMTRPWDHSPGDRSPQPYRPPSPRDDGRRPGRIYDTSRRPPTGLGDRPDPRSIHPSSYTAPRRPAYPARPTYPWENPYIGHMTQPEQFYPGQVYPGQVYPGIPGSDVHPASRPGTLPSHSRLVPENRDPGGDRPAPGGIRRNGRGRDGHSRIPKVPRLRPETPIRPEDAESHVPSVGSMTFESKDFESLENSGELPPPRESEGLRPSGPRGRPPLYPDPLHRDRGGDPVRVDPRLDPRADHSKENSSLLNYSHSEEGSPRSPHQSPLRLSSGGRLGPSHDWLPQIPGLVPPFFLPLSPVSEPSSLSDLGASFRLATSFNLMKDSNPGYGSFLDPDDSLFGFKLYDLKRGEGGKGFQDDLDLEDDLSEEQGERPKSPGRSL